MPIVLTIVLMGLNIALMIWWIIKLAQTGAWTGLTLGTIAFSVVLIGLSFYLLLMIKQRQLNQRQINFVDSVTHELKSPIASLRLYLETLQLRDLDIEKRSEFYQTMERELARLDDMINQLLHVARLDAIGQDSPSNDVALDSFLETCALSACERQRIDFKSVFDMRLVNAVVHAPQIVLEMIFRNLFDNAIKYGGGEPRVEVYMRTNKTHVEVEITDNGDGIAPELKKKIFHLFFRGGDELQRRQKGTGIGLYIVQTLVRKLRGKISIQDRDDASGTIFSVELPRSLEAQ